MWQVILLTKEELILYWRETSEQDFKTMINLFKSKDYHWSLFIGHLVIEKLMKAIYVKNTPFDSNPPKTHDLLVISEKAGLTTTEMQKDLLDMFTTFNISTRYPDYKQNFYKKCTEEFTNNRINEIKELRLWLISILESK
jgi:HEPN domain-containing protein